MYDKRLYLLASPLCILLEGVIWVVRMAFQATQGTSHPVRVQPSLHLILPAE